MEGIAVGTGADEQTDASADSVGGAVAHRLTASTSRLEDAFADDEHLLKMQPMSMMAMTVATIPTMEMPIGVTALIQMRVTGAQVAVMSPLAPEMTSWGREAKLVDVLTTRKA